jgi:GGDEF domain-containing protein
MAMVMKLADSIILQVGQYLQTHTRIEDVVCRFGGDEFLIHPA